jgi:hypothetical protein
MLSKNSILAVDDRGLKTVSIPEWGGDAYIRVLSGTERDKYEAMFNEKDTSLFKVKFVASSLCDDKGVRLFETDEDIKALAEKSSRVLNRLFDQCWEHSCLSPEAVEEAGNA